VGGVDRRATVDILSESRERSVSPRKTSLSGKEGACIRRTGKGAGKIDTRGRVKKVSTEKEKGGRTEMCGPLGSLKKGHRDFQG